MGRVKLVLKALAGTLAFLLYVWFKAVRSAPPVKRRKRARRARGGPLGIRRPDRSPEPISQRHPDQGSASTGI
jgi:hypothetical protein